MRVGLGLMNAGETIRYSSLSRIAQHAEALGYDSLWVTEREPFPVVARTSSPAFNGESHLARKAVDGTLDALAIAAINTDTIRLGISLPNIPFYSPVELGRSLAALDVLSDGRVQVGLGLGWQASEFRSVLTTLAQSETPANEFVHALRSTWERTEGGFVGEYFSLPQLVGGVTPIQRPYPPILMMAFAPAAVQKSALLLRGGSPLTLAMSSGEMADALQVAAMAAREERTAFGVRAVVRLTHGPIGESRAMFTGSIDQLREDIAVVEQLGASEVQLDLCQMASGLDHGGLLALVTQLRDLVPSRVALAA